MNMILRETTAVRFFRGDKKRRAKYLKLFKGRWENDSHFIRSACLVYMRMLDREKVKP